MTLVAAGSLRTRGRLTNPVADQRPARYGHPMTDPQTTFDHTRAADGEHVGYIAMTAEGEFIPFDLLRRQRGDAGELDEAEALLDEIGLSVLTETFTLADEDIRVRIRELTRDTVTVAPMMGDLDPTAQAPDLTRTWTLPLPTSRLG